MATGVSISATTVSGRFYNYGSIHFQTVRNTNVHIYFINYSNRLLPVSSLNFSQVGQVIKFFPISFQASSAASLIKETGRDTVLYRIRFLVWEVPLGLSNQIKSNLTQIVVCVPLNRWHRTNRLDLIWPIVKHVTFNRHSSYLSFTDQSRFALVRDTGYVLTWRQ